jgi:hypothetical protein
MVPEELCCSHTANDAFGDVSLTMGTVIAAPCVLLFTNEDDIVVAVGIPVAIAIPTILTLLEEGLLTVAAPIHLFDFALVVVVFIPTLSAGDRSLLGNFGALNNLIGRLLATDNYLLAHGFLDDDGLGRLLTYDDGLGCGSFRAEVLSRPRVLLQLEGSFPQGLEVTLILAFNPVLFLSHSRLSLILALYAVLSFPQWRRRRRSTDVAGDAVFANFSDRRRGRAVDFALDVAVLSHFAGRRLVTLDDILPSVTVLMTRLVVDVTADDAQLGFVAVFFQAVIRDLVALHRSVGAGRGAGGARVPVPLPFALSVKDRHFWRLGNCAAWC